MLTEEELNAYFDRLPRDVTIVVNGEEYKANKQIMTSFSPVFKKVCDEKGISNGKVVLSVTDPENLFENVVDFLHHKQIEITFFNDFYLNKIAQELEISQLIECTSESLNTEISVHNIIPRIIQGALPSESLIPFLYDHIEDIKDNKDIFKLPKDILKNICTLNEVRFENPTSRYIFKFYCAANDLDNAKDFISEEDVKNMPVEAIEILVTDPELEKLDGVIPTFEIASRIITSIRENEEKLTDIRSNISSIITEISRLRLELDRESRANLRNNDVYNEIKEKERATKEKIKTIITNISSKFEQIKSFGIKSEKMDEISADLGFLKTKCREMESTISSLQSRVVINAGLVAKIKETQKQWKDKMETLQLFIGETQPNENEITEILQSFNQILTELHDLSE